MSRVVVSYSKHLTFRVTLERPFTQGSCYQGSLHTRLCNDESSSLYFIYLACYTTLYISVSARFVTIKTKCNINFMFKSNQLTKHSIQPIYPLRFFITTTRRNKSRWMSIFVIMILVRVTHQPLPRNLISSVSTPGI